MRSILALVTVPLVVMTQVQANSVIELFQDTSCQVPVPGAGSIEVDSGNCKGYETGWSSAIITSSTDSPGPSFYGAYYCNGTQVYNNPAYVDQENVCINFGFIANSVFA